MTEVYLIAHKVRGEAAYDVASPLEVGQEIWWIIPTSGHRAYPYWKMPIIEPCPPMPEGIPDHYRAARPAEKSVQLDELDLKELGLL